MHKSFWKGITRNIILLWLVSMFTDLSSQIIFPLIPLFLTSLGAGATVVGIVEGAAETTASFLKVISWYFSDKFKKRKLFVFLGYSMSTITKPLFAIAKTWPMVLIFRVIERIGKWVREAPRDALIAESVNPKHIWVAYGFQRTMDGFGSVLGAILALIIFPLLWYSKTFLVAAIPWILAVVTILFVKESRKMKAEHKQLKADQHDGIIAPKFGILQWFKELPRNLIFFIITASVFTLWNFGYVFLLLKSKSIGLTDTNAIVYYVIFYGVFTLLSTPFGWLSDKLWKKIILQIGYALFVLVALWLAFISSAPLLIIFFVLYGIFFALTDGVQRALVAQLSPKKHKATALWIFHTCIGIVALPGAYLVGLLRDKINPNMAFLFCMVIGFIAFVMLMFVKKSKIY